MDTLTGSNGCDSISTLILEINPILAEYKNASVCEGYSYDFGGEALTKSGTYVDTLLASSGCDSVVTLSLIVKAQSSMSETVNICEGDSYYFGSQTLTSSGVYEETYQSVNGCDSVVTLTLDVKAQMSSIESIIICEGFSYSFNGRNLKTSGTYTDTISSFYGCDSVITLVLNVDSKSPITIGFFETEYYLNNGDVTLTFASPLGGEYSGNGIISAGVFNTQAAGIGTHNIIYTINNANGCLTRDSIKLTVKGLETSVIENETQSLFVYPNPFNNRLYIHINAVESADVQTQFYDTRGNIVKVSNERVVAGENVIEIETYSLERGIYNLRIGHNNMHEVFKVAKTR